MRIELNNNQYFITNKLGGGTFSSVYSATSQGQVFALKSVKHIAAIADDNPKTAAMIHQQLEHLFKEYLITEQLTKSGSLGHVPLKGSGYGRVYQSDGSTLAKIDHHQRRFIMLYPQADFDALAWSKLHQRDLVAVLELLSQVAFCLSQIHQANVVHRDIKLENILIFSHHELEMKITDFGSALSFYDQVEKINGTAMVGSPSNQAPEYRNVNSQLALYDTSVDIYGLASCITQWFGIHQYSRHNEKTATTPNINNHLADAIKTLQHSSENTNMVKAKLYDLLLIMLSKVTEQRPTAQEVYLHVNSLLSNLGETASIESIFNSSRQSKAQQQLQNPSKALTKLITKAKPWQINWQWLNRAVIAAISIGLLLLKFNHSTNNERPFNIAKLEITNLTMQMLCDNSDQFNRQIIDKLVANCAEIGKLTAVIVAAQQASSRNPAIMDDKINSFENQRKNLHQQNQQLIKLVRQQNQLNFAIHTAIVKRE